ncbi:hypothetical protein ABZP36_006333 [Zizania latifolia]
MPPARRRRPPRGPTTRMSPPLPPTSSRSPQPSSPPPPRPSEPRPTSSNSSTPSPTRTPSSSPSPGPWSCPSPTARDPGARAPQRCFSASCSSTPPTRRAGATYSPLAQLAIQDPPLAALAVACFELAWRVAAPGRDALVAQTLPYLFSQALTCSSSARPVLRRLFALRDALALLDYADDSISDFKMLLLRCFVSPLFLKADEGRKLLALVLGDSEGLAREGLELIRA